MEPARVIVPGLVIFGLDAIQGTFYTEVAVDHLGVGSIIGAVLFASSSLGLTFYAGMLERLVGSVERGEPAQPVLTVLRTLPWGRLLVAEAILVVISRGGLGGAGRAGPDRGDGLRPGRPAHQPARLLGAPGVQALAAAGVAALHAGLRHHHPAAGGRARGRGLRRRADSPRAHLGGLPHDLHPRRPLRHGIGPHGGDPGRAARDGSAGARSGPTVGGRGAAESEAARPRPARSTTQPTQPTRTTTPYATRPTTPIQTHPRRPTMEETIHGTTMPVLELSLADGESIVSEAGEFSWMSDAVQMATNTGGGMGGKGIMGAVKRAVVRRQLHDDDLHRPGRRRLHRLRLEVPRAHPADRRGARGTSSWCTATASWRPRRGSSCPWDSSSRSAAASSAARASSCRRSAARAGRSSTSRAR